MTSPQPQPVADLSEIVPKKWKPVVGLVGSLLTLIVPSIIQAESSLPPVWTVVIGAVLAVLTALGVYKAPYQPEGTVLAPATPEVIDAATITPSAPPAEATPQTPIKPPVPPVVHDDGDYHNPWKT